VQHGEFDFRYTMPAESVATFVWQPAAVAPKPATTTAKAHEPLPARE
jgi:hypothetical protein